MFLKRGGFSVLLVLIFFLLMWAGVPDARGADTEAIQNIAEKGNEATVAVYCRRGKHEGFYGTGSVVSDDGYILTSTTVVPRGAEDIQIFFTNHTKMKAEIVEINEEVEATLLKVEAQGLTSFPATLKIPMLGETCYTWGNATNAIRQGENASFSAGLVTGVYQVKSTESQSSYQGLAIESDAAINPGQDGGPFCNSQGQLVGMVSLSYSNLRWQGVAIPLPLILKGLRTVKAGKIRFKKNPWYTPETGSEQEKAFLDRMNRIGKILVHIKVKRKYGTEQLKSIPYADFISSLSGLSDEEARKRLADYSTADRLIGANQQLRRPDKPVTGFIISPNGHILTSLFNVGEDSVLLHKEKGLLSFAYHDSMQKDLFPYKNDEYKLDKNTVESITVTYRDREYKAEILGKSIPHGIALLKIDAANLPFMNINTVAAQPKVCQTVAAVGIIPAEGTYTFTLNTGIVSTTSRRQGLAFQFDAIINYGNSGGPLVGLNGEFLGISLDPLSSPPIMGRVLSFQELQRWTTSINSGVSFGARADAIKEVLPRLLKGENIESLKSPYFGVTQDQRFAFSEKVVIGEVAKGSPAEQAGLKKGDIMMQMDGIELSSWKQMLEVLFERNPGDVIMVKVKRGDQELHFNVTLGEKK